MRIVADRSFVVGTQDKSFCLPTNWQSGMRPPIWFLDSSEVRLIRHRVVQDSRDILWKEA
jgi:hypothetical protein